MLVTVFPVMARILTDRNMHRTRIGSIALASAATDGVLAWSLLAVVAAIACAGSEQYRLLLARLDELRTPLNENRLLMLLERMFGELNERQDDDSCARHLEFWESIPLELLNDILTCRKIEAGQMAEPPGNRLR